MNLATIQTLAVFTTDSSGAHRLGLPVPAVHAFTGLEFCAQTITFVKAGPFGGAELSNGLQLRLGYAR